MKTDPATISARRAGFSLIEMIGVLAIMAILASVVAPNALQSIERAAIRAEVATLDSVGTQLKLYLRDNGALPTMAIPNTTPNWTTQLGTYADLSPADLLTNRRSINRVYIVDPTPPAGRRAIILSSMRSGHNLPAATTINTAARFNDLWQTTDGELPTTTSWNGWNNAPWSTTANAGDYLLIERVNLASVYATDLLPLTVTLNNHGGGTVSYRVTDVAGNLGAPFNILAGATATLVNLRPRERIDLYAGAGGAGVVDYSYVLSTTGKTFDFDGTQWLPH